MLALRVIEQLDVLEHVLPGGIAGRVRPSPDALPLQELEDAFGDGVVVAVPASVHTRLKVALAEEGLPLPAGELGALVRMHRDPVVGLSSPDGHQQCLQGEVGGHARLSRPADDLAREQVDDDAEIRPALMGLDVGDVGHTELIGPGRLETLLEPVLGNDRGLAAISAGTTPVADLRGDPGQ